MHHVSGYVYYPPLLSYL